MSAGPLRVSPLRVGFLGAGFIATMHSKLLRAAGSTIERAGVFDIDAERTARFAAASGHRGCNSEDEVLDTCDAVIVCTWTSEHRRLVEAAASRCLAVLCEKPLATTLADAQAMRSAVNAAGVVNQVGLVLRFIPRWVMAVELAHDPLAGRVMAVVFRDDQYIPVQGQYASTWRGDVTRAGAGVLLEHSVHDLDMLELIGGPIDTVCAHTSNFHQIAGIEDVATAMFSFTNGAHATLATVWHDNLARPSGRHVEIICERRMITLAGDDFDGPISWQDSNGTVATLHGDALNAAASALLVRGPNPDIAFVRAALDNTPAAPDFVDAVRAQTIADACYRSAASNTTVHI